MFIKYIRVSNKVIKRLILLCFFVSVIAYFSIYYYNKNINDIKNYSLCDKEKMYIYLYERT